jgi:hypothetical protein
LSHLKSKFPVCLTLASRRIRVWTCLDYYPSIIHPAISAPLLPLASSTTKTLLNPGPVNSEPRCWSNSYMFQRPWKRAQEPPAESTPMNSAVFLCNCAPSNAFKLTQTEFKRGQMTARRLGHFRPAQLGATPEHVLALQVIPRTHWARRGMYVHPQGGEQQAGRRPQFPAVDELGVHSLAGSFAHQSALQFSPWPLRCIIPRLLVRRWNAARVLTRGTHMRRIQLLSRLARHSLQFGIAGHRLVARAGEAAIDPGLQGTTSCISASWAIIQWQRGMFQGHRNTPCNRRPGCATLPNCFIRHPSPHLSQLSTWPGGGTLLQPFQPWPIHEMRGTAPWP